MTNTTTTQGQSPARQVTSTAKDEAANVMHDARTQGRRLANQSREQLRQTADEQGQRLAATLRDLGSQLHGMAAGTTAPKGMLADVTEQAASSARQLAGSLDDKGVQGVIDDVKRFARRRPGVFIAGAVAAGIVTGRLIRSLDTGAVMDATKPSTESDQNSDPAPLPNGPNGPNGPMAATAPIGTTALNRPKEF